MLPSGLILGHSFVRRFGNFLGVSSSNAASRRRVPKLLGMGHIIHQVAIKGIPGGKVKYLTVPNELWYFTPDFVVIDIGSNDLASGECPLKTASDLVDFSKRLIYEYGVKNVYICTALYRGRNAVPDEKTFAKKVVHYNDILKNFCAVETNIHYHTHRGFWTTNIRSWSNDDIHPLPAKYAKCIKDVLYIALKNINRRN